MAEKASGKVLWVLPKNTANDFLGAAIVTVVAAFVWSFLLQIDFIHDHAYATIIMWLIFAAIVGYAVGMIRGNASQSTLWTAAGFTALGVVLTNGLAAYAPAGADAALYQSLGSEVFTASVNGVYLVLGIVAASFATMGSESKM